MSKLQSFKDSFSLRMKHQYFGWVELLGSFSCSILPSAPRDTATVFPLVKDTLLSEVLKYFKSESFWEFSSKCKVDIERRVDRALHGKLSINGVELQVLDFESLGFRPEFEADQREAFMRSFRESLEAKGMSSSEIESILLDLPSLSLEKLAIKSREISQIDGETEPG